MGQVKDLNPYWIFKKKILNLSLTHLFHFKLDLLLVKKKMGI